MDPKICFYCGEVIQDDPVVHLGQTFCSEECSQVVDEDECVMAGSMSPEEYREYKDGEMREDLSYFDLG